MASQAVNANTAADSSAGPSSAPAATTSQQQAGGRVVVPSLRAMGLLLDRLRDRGTPPLQFKQCADRFMALLAEEASGRVCVSVRVCVHDVGGWPRRTL